MKTISFLKTIAIAMLLGGMSAACSSDEPTTGDDSTPEVTNPDEEEPVTEARSDEEVMLGLQDFTFNLFNGLTESAENKNVVVGPYSVYTVLAMVANGADENTLKHLAKEFNATNLEQVNNLNQRIINTLTTVDEKTTFKSTNSVWIHPSLNYLDTYTDAITKYYKGDALKANLNTMEGVNAVNKWCSDATNGMISKMLTSPIEYLMTINNATYFKGTWTTEFNPEATIDYLFNGPEGEKTVKMMTCSGEFDYADYADGSKIARLPYGNKSFRMTVILPPIETPINAYAQEFTAEKWNAIRNLEFISSENSLGIPRFMVSDQTNIALKVVEVMPYSMTCHYKELAQDVDYNIDMLLHGAVVVVNEEGTEAAAVTMGPGPSSSPKHEFICNRPFMFVIDEASTGVVLFMGTVNDVIAAE